MFFSQLKINPRRREARKLLGSPQAMHAAVCAGFSVPVRELSGSGRVLWRVDQHEHSSSLYIISPQAPDLTHLVEQAGWPTLETWRSTDYSPFLSRLADGQRWQFRLAANPTKTIKPHSSSARSQRVGHVTVAFQELWLLKRAEQWGIDLGELYDASQEGDSDMREKLEAGNSQKTFRLDSRGVRTFKRGGAAVTINTAVFTGQLRITNAEVFREQLSQGFGSAKAYGCGLMTLLPLAASATAAA